MENLIKAANGEIELDLAIRGGRIVSTFLGKIVEGDVGIKDGVIVTLDAKNLKAREEILLKGEYIAPSFIDAHIHIESSMLSPERFCEVVLPRGTGSVISDPHEIANVKGIDGISYIFEASMNLPLDFFFTIPSCVPATHLETSGAILTSKDITKIYKIIKNSPSLSEMMNYLGVIFRDSEVLRKIDIAKKLDLKIDGHSPSLSGTSLDAYLSAGVETDHESTSKEEVEEKLKKGCFILLREGSASKNLKECLKALNSKNIERFAIVSDDRHPETLLKEGHLDDSLRKAIKWGIDEIDAIKMVTINPARFYNLHRKGAVAINYFADLVILKELKRFKVKYVIYKGKVVFKDGEMVEKIKIHKDKKVLSSVKLPSNLKEKLNYPLKGKARVIKVFGDEILTKEEISDLKELENGKINYLAVVERHNKNGNVGIGFVKGFNLKRGALGSTISHDSHNIVVVSKSIEEMLLACETLEKIGGGIVAVDGKECVSLKLEVAGLLTTESAEKVCETLRELHKKAKELGCNFKSPFMTLSFIALPVIPQLRLTDKGLVDVRKFDFVPLNL